MSVKKITSDKLTTLLAENEAIWRAVDAINAQIREERLRLICQHYGVEIGSIVDVKGRRFKVTEIMLDFEPPWLKGVPARRDGTWSASVRHLYGDWVLVTEQQQPAEGKGQ